MRHYLLVLLLLSSPCAYADIIATYNNGKIENVKVISIAADSVIYKQGEVRKAIVSADVEGVLYDNGRFVVPPREKIAITPLESTDAELHTTDTPISGSKLLNRWENRLNAMKNLKQDMKEQLIFQRKERKALKNQLKAEKEQMKAERKAQLIRQAQQKEGLELDNASSATILANEDNW